jgi:hypothetical protein
MKYHARLHGMKKGEEKLQGGNEGCPSISTTTAPFSSCRLRLKLMPLSVQSGPLTMDDWDGDGHPFAILCSRSPEPSSPVLPHASSLSQIHPPSISDPYSHTSISQLNSNKKRYLLGHDEGDDSLSEESDREGDQTDRGLEEETVEGWNGEEDLYDDGWVYDESGGPSAVEEKDLSDERSDADSSEDNSLPDDEGDQALDQSSENSSQFPARDSQSQSQQQAPCRLAREVKKFAFLPSHRIPSQPTSHALCLNADSLVFALRLLSSELKRYLLSPTPSSTCSISSRHRSPHRGCRCLRRMTMGSATMAVVEKE